MPSKPAAPEAIATPLPSGFHLSSQKLDGYARYLLRRSQGWDLRNSPPGAGESARLLQAKVKAEEQARAQAGLTEDDVRQLDALLAEVLEARDVESALTADGAIEAWDRLRPKLPPSQRADLDASIEKMRRDRDEAKALSRARKKFGSENVDLLLTREGELTQSYNAWLSRLTGTR